MVARVAGNGRVALRGVIKIDQPEAESWERYSVSL
jgi:hypothetical protein